MLSQIAIYSKTCNFIFILLNVYNGAFCEKRLTALSCELAMQCFTGFSIHFLLVDHKYKQIVYGKDEPQENFEAR